MTTYYVSSSDTSASDSNNGTSISTPWKTLGKVSSGTVQAALKPGDKILLKSGDVFYGTLSIRSSGTSTAPITIGKYGTGAKPIIMGDHSNAVWTAESGYPGIFSTSGYWGTYSPGSGGQVYDSEGVHYVHSPNRGTTPLTDWLKNLGSGASTYTFINTNANANKQIALQRPGSTAIAKIIIAAQETIAATALEGKVWVYGGKDTSGNDILLPPGSQGVTITKKGPPNVFTFDSSANKTYIKPASGVLPKTVHFLEFEVVGVHSTTTSYSWLIFEDLDIRNAHIGFNIYGSNHIVRRCNIQDLTSMAILFTKTTNCEVSYNTTRRTGWTSIYSQHNKNFWVHHNDVADSMSTILGARISIDGGIERCGIGIQQSVNSLVEYNRIENMKSGSIDFYYEANPIIRFNYLKGPGGPSLMMACGGLMYGNICDCVGGRGIGAAYIYNIEMNPDFKPIPNVVFNNTILGASGYGLFVSTNGGVILRNNIVSVTGNTAMILFERGVTTYNGDNNLFYNPSGTVNLNGYKSLLTWQQATGQETNSKVGNPLFVSSTPTVASDFKLQSTSPAINAGQNLFSVDLVPSPYTDYFGTSIPQSGATDIGAYEYTGTVTVPTTPSLDTIAPVLTSSLLSSSATANSITVNWTKATDTVSSSTKLGYKVYLSTLNNLTSVSTIDSVGRLEVIGTDINSCTIDGLLPNTTYYINVLVHDEAGNRTLYTTKSQTTAAAQQLLPVPGGSQDTWGTVLNSYLLVSHNNDGTLKTAAVAQTLFGTTNTTNIDIKGTLRVQQLATFNSQYSSSLPFNTSSATTSINWDKGVRQKLVLSTSVTTLYLINPTPGGIYELIVTQDGTGGRTITWPANVKWSGGTIPTIPSTANASIIITFFYDGQNYFGSIGKI
jgi:hypothetical protein